MKGLPRSKDTSRPRDTFALMVLGPIERTTEALRRGDPFSEQSLHDMVALQRRLEAFSAALEARMQEHNAVLEDE